ncbi:carboxypeptidase-like regulatory domain-containing protein [Bacteroides faecis]|nr:carboxypeptidase-like regulatory domain-containing protein [Bacteroides faecis]
MDSNRLVTDRIRFIFCPSPFAGTDLCKEVLTGTEKEGLPEALKQIEKAGGKNILFTYNGTESYRVTVSIHEKTECEAIDLVLTGKPFVCIEREEYFVVQRKKSDKAIAVEGKVYDEKGMPLPFVNILALAADSSFLAGSVTEEDGSFHLPPIAGEDCLLKATYIGYCPQIIPCRQQNTIRLQPDTELLKEVVITASRPPDRTERRNADSQHSRNAPFTDGIGQRNDLPPPFCHRLGRRIYRTGQRHPRNLYQRSQSQRQD